MRPSAWLRGSSGRHGHSDATAARTTIGRWCRCGRARSARRCRPECRAAAVSSRSPRSRRPRARTEARTVVLSAFMPPEFTRAQVEAVAALANLQLEPAEVDLFAKQLGDVLAHAEELKQIDTTGVSPTAYGVAPKGV